MQYPTNPHPRLPDDPFDDDEEGNPPRTPNPLFDDDDGPDAPNNDETPIDDADDPEAALLLAWSARTLGCPTHVLPGTAVFHLALDLVHARLATLTPAVEVERGMWFYRMEVSR